MSRADLRAVRPWSNARRQECAAENALHSRTDRHSCGGEAPRNPRITCQLQRSLGIMACLSQSIGHRR
jgi:hypothetical protein